MKIRVLGSAAGGGFPQWNCNCRNCARLRSGDIDARARTQSSIAVSADGKAWVLFNASPDVRQQLEAFPEAHPRRGVRDTGVCAVLLIDAHIDHTAGLFILREGDPLNIYCTDPVFSDLTTGNPVLNLLSHYCGVNRSSIPLDTEAGFLIEGIDGLRFSAIALSGKPPPFSPRRNNPVAGDNIGIRVDDERTGGSLFYAPGLAGIDAQVERCFEECDCLLVDGTFWTDDELIQHGANSKRASDMGHLPQSGEGGMVEVLQPIAETRKILIHINNTNPILDEASPERAELDAAGIEVAHDGMEITL
jgi:pyrroloquinoline quinone biosynthesis protein B